ncbi:hypothetical protein [Arthrobacter koreensis]|uniref:hypothetical protein n=1 Tax=Arthrobacter koreensis TaxID=199136 RepID=UPI00381D4844
MLFKTHPDVTPGPDTNDLGEPQSAHALLTDKRGLSTSIAESLGSIGLGVLLLVGLTVGIGAAWNYGQDSTAKSTLDSVKSAQVLQKAKTGSYGTVENLTDGADPALTSVSDDLKITASETDYCAVVKSRSMTGPTYWMTAKTGKVLDAAPSAAEAGVTCPTI